MFQALLALAEKILSATISASMLDYIQGLLDPILALFK